VELFELFAAEFQIAASSELPKVLVEFHELGLQHSRPWLICRRIFGIGPVIPSPDAHPDDLRPHTRKELGETMGITGEELQAELDALRAIWSNAMRSLECGGGNEETRKEEGPQPALAFADNVLRDFGFSEEMFRVSSWNAETKQTVNRPAEDNRIERDWFCSRLESWRKPLAEQVGGALAREALMNELYLRRFSADMMKLSPGSKQFRELYDLKKQIETNLQEQLMELQEMYPEMSIQSRQSFRGVISDLNLAHRNYYSTGDRKLVDRVNTATEVEILLRQSVQSPAPRYRMGLNIAIVEAMHNLYDPNFRSQFKPKILKKLDAGFRAAVVAMQEAQKEPLVDLQNGVMPGEGDDFEDLLEPKNEK
jgi:hypothetical protein